MRIYYQLADFVSHARAGRANMRALRIAGHELVDDPARAELAIVHDEPVYLERHRRALPSGLPVVAYAVVETDPMPPAYAQPLMDVREVWTCSEFSRELLAREVDNVYVVPHVVARPSFSRADTERVRALLVEGGLDAQELDHTYLFHTVCDGINPRKNLPALLRAFILLVEPRARLVVKQYRKNLDLSGLPRVVSITEELTDSEMAALNASCHCYVSAHRAEGWGLGLSEAMAFGRPVVATGYSGNMEFMNRDNSYPVPYTLRAIEPDDLLRCPPFFTPDMRWAEVDEPALALAMRQAMREGTEQGRRAARDVKAFDPQRVAALMDQRLKRLAGDISTPVEGV